MKFVKLLVVMSSVNLLVESAGAVEVTARRDIRNIKYSAKALPLAKVRSAIDMSENGKILMQLASGAVVVVGPISSNASTPLPITSVCNGLNLSANQTLSRAFINSAGAFQFQMRNDLSGATSNFSGDANRCAAQISAVDGFNERGWQLSRGSNGQFIQSNEAQIGINGGYAWALNDLGIAFGQGFVGSEYQNVIWNLPGQQSWDSTQVVYAQATLASVYGTNFIHFNNFGRIAMNSVDPFDTWGYVRIADINSGYSSFVRGINSPAPAADPAEVYVNAINDSSLVVGRSRVRTHDPEVSVLHGFVSSGGSSTYTIDLNSQLSNGLDYNLNNGATGNYIQEAKRISNRGNIIAETTYSGVLGAASSYVVLLADKPLSCRGDFNADGMIDSKDLNFLLGLFGTSSAKADLNVDDRVDTNDLKILIRRLGRSCASYELMNLNDQMTSVIEQPQVEQ